MEKWIGTKAVRIAAAVVAAASAATLAIAYGAPDGTLRSALGLLGTILALLTLLGFILSFQKVYARWMRFAAILQKIFVTIFFGLCYLLIVPFFSLLLRKADPLKLRTPSDQTSSFWRTREPDNTSSDSYLRMG